MSDRPRPDDIAYLAGLVREFDRPRYYATLFSPEPLRADLFALYGFAVEIQRIPDQVRDPTLGRIRLQWWRDSLTGDGRNAAVGETPALRALRSVIGRHALPLAPFEALVEARDADLYSDPPATLAELEQFFGDTEASLFQIGSAVAGEGLPEPARRAGLAYGLARRLARFPADRPRGHAMIPSDLLASEGLGASDVFLRDRDQDLHRAILVLAGLARDHLHAAQVRPVPRGVLPIFLPLVIVEPLLAQLERQDPASLNEAASLSDLTILVRMAWAKLRGGFGKFDRRA